MHPGSTNVTSLRSVFTSTRKLSYLWISTPWITSLVVHYYSAPVVQFLSALDTPPARLAKSTKRCAMGSREQAKLHPISSYRDNKAVCRTSSGISSKVVEYIQLRNVFVELRSGICLSSKYSKWVRCRSKLCRIHLLF